MDNNAWDYFPSSNKEKYNYNRLLTTVVGRENRNKDAFTSIRRKIHDHVIVEETETENKTSESTNRIFCLQKLETVLNHNVCCLCHDNDIFYEFIEYSYRIDISLKKIKELKEKYKRVKNGTLKVREKCIGIATN